MKKEVSRSLQEFLSAMVNKFKEKEPKYGPIENDCPLEDLRIHFKDEVKEWIEAIGMEGESKECIDITNLAYLIWRQTRLVGAGISSKGRHIKIKPQDLNTGIDIIPLNESDLNERNV